MIEEKINVHNFKYFDEKLLGELENSVKKGLKYSKVFDINMGNFKEKAEEAGLYLKLNGYNVTQTKDSQRYWLSVKKK